MENVKSFAKSPLWSGNKYFWGVNGSISAIHTKRHPQNQAEHMCSALILIEEELRATLWWSPTKSLFHEAPRELFACDRCVVIISKYSGASFSEGKSHYTVWNGLWRFICNETESHSAFDRTNSIHASPKCIAIGMTGGISDRVDNLKKKVRRHNSDCLHVCFNNYIAIAYMCTSYSSTETAALTTVYNNGWATM